AAAQRERAVVEDDLRFADLNASAARESDRRLDHRAVIQRAVSRTEILQLVFVTFVANLGVNPRGKWIGDTQVVSRGATDGHAQPSDLEVFRSAVWILND